MSLRVKLIRSQEYFAEFEKQDGERFILSCIGTGRISKAAEYDTKKEEGERLLALFHSANHWETVRATTPRNPPTREDWVSMLKVFGYTLPEIKEVFVGPEEVSEDIGYDSEGKKYDLGDEGYEFILKDTIPVKAVFGHYQNGHVYRTPDSDWLMVWPGADGKIRFRRAGSYSTLIFPYVMPKGKQYKEATLPGHLENGEVLLSQGYHVVSSEEKEVDPREVVKEPASLRDFIQSMYQEACEEETNLKALGLDPEKDKELIANLKEQIAKAPPGSTILIITR